MVTNMMTIDKIKNNPGKYSASFSDRFTAKMSETTKTGNYMNKVWDSIRNHGVLPESDWSAPVDFTWDSYYAEIPQALKDKARGFVERFSVQYEWVLVGQEDRATQKNLITKASKQAPVQIASLPIQGASPVQDKGCGSQHATIVYIVSNGYNIFDHYDPFLFTGVDNFCIPWAIKGILVPKNIATVDITQYEGKCIESPTGRAYVVIGGKRYESPDALTWYSCGYTYEMIEKVSQTVIDMIPKYKENGGYLNYQGSKHQAMFDSMRKHKAQFKTWF